VSGSGISHRVTRPDLPLLVIVTGPPASGKTTLASAIARELRLPLITKDGLKETLFDALGTGDRDWSRRLGRASIELMFTVLAGQLAAGLPIVAEANFWRSYDSARFRSLPPHRVIQLLVTAPRALLLERYRERVRHPGHLGASVVPEMEIALAAGEWTSLELGGELIELEASSAIDLEPLIVRIQALLAVSIGNRPEEARFD